MIDVMDSLEDSASYFAYQSVPNTLEILSIEPQKHDPIKKRMNRAKVHHVPLRRSTDVVNYLIERELRDTKISA